MRLILTVVFAFLSLSAPSATVAQDTADERAQLAERFIAITARGSLEEALTEQIETLAAGMDQATEEQRAWYRANALPILQPHLQAMIDRLEARYVETFTVEELRALVVFYDSPQGRSIAGKQNVIGVAQGAETLDMGNAYVADLLGKYCARFQCATGADQGGTAKGG